MRKVAFREDWYVREYHNSNLALEISAPQLSGFIYHHLSAYLNELLHKDWKQRPTATTVSRMCNYYCLLLSLSCLPSLETSFPYPSYLEWKGFVHKSVTAQQLFHRLAEWYEDVGAQHISEALLFELSAWISRFHISTLQGDLNGRRSAMDIEAERASTIEANFEELLSDVGKEPSASLLEIDMFNVSLPSTHAPTVDISFSKIDPSELQSYANAIAAEPINYWLWHGLLKLYGVNGSLDGAFYACKIGQVKYPHSLAPLMELSNLYASIGDYRTAITMSMQVFESGGTWLLTREKLRAALAQPRFSGLQILRSAIR